MHIKQLIIFGLFYFPLQTFSSQQSNVDDEVKITVLGETINVDEEIHNQPWCSSQSQTQPNLFEDNNYSYNVENNKARCINLLKNIMICNKIIGIQLKIINVENALKKGDFLKAMHHKLSLELEYILLKEYLNKEQSKKDEGNI